MQEQKASRPVLGHLRANLWLLVLSLVICCVLYPGAVWVVGQLFFHDQAEGSLIGADGKPTSDPAKAVGSTQIAQQFNSAWFFQPRPSAASYNGAASGGSNYAASNPKLRGRVAQLLGTISRYSESYKKAHPNAEGGEPNPQDDLKAWFKNETDARRDLFTEWASNNTTLAQAWATGTPAINDTIQDWVDKHPEVVDGWKKANPGATKKPGSGDLVASFFTSYEKEHFGKWPTQEAPGDVTTRIAAWAKDHPDLAGKWKEANPDKGEPKDEDLVAFFYQDYPNNPKNWPPLDPGEWVDAAQKAIVKPDAQDSDVEGIFFDAWLTERVLKTKDLDPLKDFDQVPADMVTTSGSGLDPDISLKNARYQEDGVVAANVDKIVADHEKATKTPLTDEQKAQVKARIGPEVKKAVDGLLDELASRPMFGLTSDDPLVNVLQLNLRLQAETAKIKVQ